MLERLWQECVVKPSDIQPSREDLEIIGVFNPGVAVYKGEVVLLARVAERVKQTREGYTGLPRFVPEQGLTVDWFKNEEVNKFDPRCYSIKSDGSYRLTSISHLRVFFLSSDKRVASLGPRFSSAMPYEAGGIEDARITQIGDTYYITYVVISSHGVSTALATTKDFQSFERQGIIFVLENKDVVFFPEKIRGEYYALHRPVSGFCRPEMWLARSPDLIHWGRHESFLGGDVQWHNDRIGAGAPPIRTEEGWLEIYHGNRRPVNESELVYYTAGALLLDPDNPLRVLKRSKGPIMVPDTPFEKRGFVGNVVFPTGVVDRGSVLLIYYGAADTCVGVAAFSKKDVMDSLK